MKIKIILLVILSLTTCVNIKAQEVTKTFIKKGNIYVQFDNADSRQITNKGLDVQAILSKNKQFVIGLRIKEDKKDQEQILNETAIILFDLVTNKEKVIVQGCKFDGSGSSLFSYAESDEFPFPGLCNITNVRISPDGQRVYFETDAWAVSSAIHYCNLSNGKIAFFHSGTLKEVLEDGNLNISITGIEENVGRYWQDWLFDKNGTKIKAIGEKSF